MLCAEDQLTRNGFRDTRCATASDQWSAPSNVLVGLEAVWVIVLVVNRANRQLTGDSR